MHNTTELPTLEAFKEEAKALRKKDPTIKNHGNALGQLARSYGYKNYKTILPHLKSNPEPTKGKAKQPDLATEELISFELNQKLDIDVLKKIFIYRDEVIEIEAMKTSLKHIPDGAKQLLYNMKKLEKDICDIPCFSIYYSDLARAYILNGEIEEAFVCVKSALAANEITKDDEGMATAFQVLTDISLVTNNLRTALKYMEEQEKYVPLYEEQLAVRNHILAALGGVSPKPTFDMSKEVSLKEALEALISDNPFAGLRGVAARRIARSSALSIDEARAEAELIGEERLLSLYEDEVFDDAEQEPLSEGDYNRTPTSNPTGFYDKNKREIFETDVAKESSGFVGRIALYEGEWMFINASMSAHLDQRLCDNLEVLDDSGWQNQVLTVEEWIEDGGSMIGGFDGSKSTMSSEEGIEEFLKKFDF